MIEKCTDVIVDWLIKCDAVKETDKELYGYALYSFFLSISPLLLAIGFGLCMGCIRQSVVIVIPFMIIRKFSGGYHTKHLASCLLCSCLLLLLCIVLSFYITCGWELACMTTAAVVSLMVFSPIDSENRALSQEEKISYKKMTIRIVVIFLLLAMVLFWAELHTYTICISIGIILSGGLQIPCILKGLIKKNEK